MPESPPDGLSDAEVDDLADLCRPFLGALPVSGVSITVISESGAQASLSSTGPVAARIDELHFELGEGPQWKAVRTGAMVMIPDVDVGPHTEWPVFGSALRELRIGAVFAVPMRMGAATVGVATLHSDSPRELSADEQRTALAIASAIAGTAVHQAVSSATDDGALETKSAPALRREVHQATGMVLAQLGTNATIAYSRLQAYAFAQGRTLQDVAHDVVNGVLHFDETSNEN